MLCWFTFHPSKIFWTYSRSLSRIFVLNNSSFLYLSVEYFFVIFLLCTFWKFVNICLFIIENILVFIMSLFRSIQWCSIHHLMSLSLLGGVSSDWQYLIVCIATAYNTNRFHFFTRMLRPKRKIKLNSHAAPVWIWIASTQNFFSTIYATIFCHKHIKSTDVRLLIIPSSYSIILQWLSRLVVWNFSKQTLLLADTNHVVCFSQY